MNQKDTYRFDIITLFPQLIEPYVTTGLIGKAWKRGLFEWYLHDLRAFGIGKHRVVDDTPYGGGSGLVLRPEPVVRALESIPAWDRCVRIVLSPQGKLWTQVKAREFITRYRQFILVCGRYEGIDERVAEYFVDEEISIGNYVLMGGEVAACVLLESLARLIPGVVGNPNSLEEESFEGMILDYPQYTRPARFRGYKVPAILRSGHHEAIQQWRRIQALKKTLKNRPELLFAHGFQDHPRDIPWLHWLEEWLSLLERKYHDIIKHSGCRTDDDMRDGGSNESDHSEI